MKISSDWNDFFIYRKKETKENIFFVLFYFVLNIDIFSS